METSDRPDRDLTPQHSPTGRPLVVVAWRICYAACFAYVGLCVVYRLFPEWFEAIELPVVPPRVATIVGTAFALAVWTIVGTALWYCVRGWGRGARGGAKQAADLGRPYLAQVELVRDWTRLWWQVTFTDDGLVLRSKDVRWLLLRFEYDRATRPPNPIRLADLSFVSVEPSRIALHFGRGGSARQLVFSPRSFADRERLLWEIAVRCPAVMDASLANSPPKIYDAAPAPVRVERAPPVAVASPSVAAGSCDALTGLDAAMSGLGSSLVADATSRPAPPRSGLGCGLFVATEPKPEPSVHDGLRKTK